MKITTMHLENDGNEIRLTRDAGLTGVCPVVEAYITKNGKDDLFCRLSDDADMNFRFETAHRVARFLYGTAKDAGCADCSSASIKRIMDLMDSML